MNISSIVVKTTHNKYESVLAKLQKADYCEVHLHEKDKIIVTVEGESTSDEIAKLKKIENIDGVLAAEMVFAYSEDELNTERQNIEFADSVPEWLNIENLKAEDIKYKGDLKKNI